MTEGGLKKDGAWVGVDLDGTLAHYDGYRGEGHIGEPIAPMVANVKAWLAAGVEVRIVTARVADSNTETWTTRTAIARWCKEHLGRILIVTASKDYGMVRLWDDRAVQVVKNTGVSLSELARELATDIVNYGDASKDVIARAEYILKVLNKEE